MSMGRYIGKRLLQLIPLLLVVTFAVYLLLDLAPGDPAVKKLNAQGTPASKEVVAQTREEMGLNRPFLVRYGSWLGHALCGDLGTSYQDDVPVTQKMLPCIGRTMVLSLVSLFAALLIAVPLGIVTAVKQDSVLDHIIRVLSFAGNAFPNFLLATLLMYGLCIKVHLFPIIASGSLEGLFLPALTLTIPLCGRLIRQFRAETLQQLESSYVEGAVSRGVRPHTILWHDVLHNALPGMLTITGHSVGILMGGSVVVEAMFGWPGLGKMAMDAITARDYPVVQAFVLFLTVLYVLLNLIVDICYRALDPRVELS